MLCLCIISLTIFSALAGQPRPIFRILGGSQVKIEDYPYMVSLQMVVGRYRMHICGGTLISPTAILTAAHCFRSPGIFAIMAGSANLSGTKGCMVPISKVVQHPKYRPLSQDYDIAVALLQKPVKISKTIQVVKLPPSSKDVPRTNGTVLGWGAAKVGSEKVSDGLKAVDLPIIEDKECIGSYPKGLVTERMFCARDKDGLKDSCQGDSGGPLIINGTIYGIVSWGFECGNPDNPGVYTRVPYFIDFINQTLKQKRKSVFNWFRKTYF